jgi:hypothetical protein
VAAERAGKGPTPGAYSVNDKAGQVFLDADRVLGPFDAALRRTVFLGRRL